MDIFLSDRFQIYYHDIYLNFSVHFDEPLLGLLRKKLMKGKVLDFSRSVIYTSVFFKTLLKLDDEALLKLLRNYGHEYEGPLVYYDKKKYEVYYKRHNKILDNPDKVYYYMKERGFEYFMLEKKTSKVHDRIHLYYCALR